MIRQQKHQKIFYLLTIPINKLIEEKRYQMHAGKFQPYRAICHTQTRSEIHLTTIVITVKAWSLLTTLITYRKFKVMTENE